jgi:cell division protein FtsW (lipid II flippase)
MSNVRPMLPDEQLNRSFKKTWLAFAVSRIHKNGVEEPLAIHHRNWKVISVWVVLFLVGLGSPRIPEPLGAWAVKVVLLLACLCVLFAYLESSSRRRSWVSLGQRPPLARTEFIAIGASVALLSGMGLGICLL